MACVLLGGQVEQDRSQLCLSLAPAQTSEEESSTLVLPMTAGAHPYSAAKQLASMSYRLMTFWQQYPHDHESARSN
eukprot:5892273-Amphidinium_carterae.1